MLRFARLPVAATFLVSAAVITVTPGCTSQPYASPQEQAQNACQAFGPKTLSGMAIGGLAGAGGGAALGAAAGGGRAAAIGAIAGGLTGLLGGALIGHSYDNRDCIAAQQALAQLRYVPVGQPVMWSNPSTGSHGSYVATSPEFAQNGQVCRQARQTAVLKGQSAPQQMLLTCREPDGDYRTVQALPTGQGQG